MAGDRDPAVVLEYRCEEFTAEIRQVEGYELRWTDHVANEWSETYPTLAVAVVRLGVLIAASGTRRYFADVPREFVRRVDDLGFILSTFIDERLEPP